MIVATFTDSAGAVHEFTSRLAFQKYIDSIYPPDPKVVAKAAAKEQLMSAETFGLDLYYDFAAENLVLGLAQEAANVKAGIKNSTKDIISNLKEGALDLVIGYIKAFPANQLDVKYITAARLLALRNAIHTKLGIPLVNTYNS